MLNVIFETTHYIEKISNMWDGVPFTKCKEFYVLDIGY